MINFKQETKMRSTKKHDPKVVEENKDENDIITKMLPNLRNLSRLFLRY